MNKWKIIFTLILIVIVFTIGFNVGGSLELRAQADEKRSELLIYAAEAEEHLKNGKLEEASLAAMGIIVLAPDIHSGYLIYGDVLSKQGYKKSALWAYQMSLNKLENESKALSLEMNEKNKNYERNLILLKIAKEQ